MFRVDGDNGFVDSGGRPVDSASAPDARATSVIDRRGRTVAAIWHDPALNTDPELVRAVCQAVLLTLEHGRLESELASTHARIVAAGDAERRKVERDLHDGAQQSLVALQIKLALAQELAPTDSEIAARLAEVGYGLEDAVQELRNLARGIHPPVLREFGLRAALASVTQRSRPPTALTADGIARYPQRSRQPSTSAVSSRCRTSSSTPARRPARRSAWPSSPTNSASISTTMASATRSRRPEGPGPACRTWPNGWPRYAEH